MGIKKSKLSSEETPDLTGPNVVLMKTKYVEKAVEPSSVWSKDISTFSMRQLMQLQKIDLKKK